MCGLVGCAGSIVPKHETAFKQLLAVDALRGEHSTGVLSVKKASFEPSIVKTVGDPYQLFDLNSFKDLMRASHLVLLGHNRQATTGKITRANAHPFDTGKLIGAHNGTLLNKHTLSDHWKFDVDSENLYHHMQEKGFHYHARYSNDRTL